MFKQGRQGTGYLKLKIAEWKFFDLYILKYPTESEIPPHKDPVPGKKHYRLNLEIKKAKSGGIFITKDPHFSFGRLHYFRSDINEHSVTKIKDGVRFVLSLGWVRKDT